MNLGPIRMGLSFVLAALPAVYGQSPAASPAKRNAAISTYSKLTFAGSERVNEHKTDAIEAALPEGGYPDKLYFDSETGLPARLISMHHSPERDTQFQEDFSDYRKVDSVLLPFEIAQTGGDATFVVKLDQVRHNVQVLRIANSPSPLYNRAILSSKTGAGKAQWQESCQAAKLACN